MCLQVNIAGEASKGGIEPGAGRASWRAAVQALPRLRLRGLMCILPAGLAAAAKRARLRGAARAAAAASTRRGLAALDTLSMGMSADFREAILEGATLVRIGTAIFGPTADDTAP